MTEDQKHEMIEEFKMMMDSFVGMPMDANTVNYINDRLQKFQAKYNTTVRFSMPSFGANDGDGEIEKSFYESLVNKPPDVLH